MTTAPRPTIGNTVARNRFDASTPATYVAMYSDGTYGPERATRAEAEADYTARTTYQEARAKLEAAVARHSTDMLIKLFTELDTGTDNSPEAREVLYRIVCELEKRRAIVFDEDASAFVIALKVEGIMIKSHDWPGESWEVTIQQHTGPGPEFATTYYVEEYSGRGGLGTFAKADTLEDARLAQTDALNRQWDEWKERKDKADEIHHAEIERDRNAWWDRQEVNA